MTATLQATSKQETDTTSTLEILISQINMPALVINKQGRVLFSNSICGSEMKILAGDRVIFQEDAESKKKILFPPMGHKTVHGKLEVFSSFETDLHGENSRVILLENDPSRQYAELLEAQKFLSTLVSNLPGMAYRCKPDSIWLMTFIQGQCYELTGYATSELVNNRSFSYGQLIVKEDRQRVWEQLQSAILENRPYQFTYRIKTKPGVIKWVWEEGRVVFSEEGRKTALEGLIIDVSDRYEVAEELLISEERYHHLVQAAPEAMVILDTKGRIVLCNRLACDLVGEANLESLVGKPAIRFLDKSSGKEILKALLHFEQKDQPLPEFACMIQRGGIALPVRIKLNQVKNPSGKTDGYVALVQKRLQEEDQFHQVREREDIFRSFVEDSPRLILRFKPDGAITFANAALCAYFDLSRQELVGRNLNDLHLHQLDAFFEETMAALSPDMQPSIREYCDKSALSGSHWFKWTTRPITNGENQFIEYQAIGEDITEQKMAEQSLKESEFKFRELLGNVRLVAIILDLQGSINFCNSYFCELVGMSMEEIIGRNWLEMFLSIDDSIAFKKLLLECALTGNFPTKRENLILTAGGEQRQIAWTNTVLHDSYGNITGIASIGQDITERSFSEKIQLAIFQISQSANQAEDLDTLYFSIHQILQELMPVDNFFIALLDPEKNLLSFPYFVDQLEEKPQPQKPGRGLTEYVLRTGKSILVNPEVFNLLVEEQEVESVGPASVDWLGVPLKVENRVIGVMGAQSYSEGIRYKYRDEQMMAFVSTQVAMAIDRKRKEQELRNSQKRNELLVEASTDAIFIETLDGKILDCNSMASKIYGFTHEQLCQMTVKDIVPPGSELIMPETAEGYIEDQGLVSETLNIRADGTLFPVELSLRLATIEGVQVVVAYVRDITERKQTEREIIESEAKFRDLADTTAAGIFIHRGEQYLYVNPAWCRMTEFSADELKNLKVTENIPEDQAEEVRQRTLIHLRGIQDVDSYELYYKTKNGVWRWFAVNSGLINFEGSRAVIGTAVDVTARKQREHEMEVIAQISEILRQNTSLNEISFAILDKIPDFLNVDAALICLDNKREGELLHYHGVGTWKALEGITLPRGQGLAYHVMDSGELYVNHTPASDPYFNFPELVQSMATLAGTPLIAQGKTLGALIVGSDHPMAEFELRLLVTVADITANGLQRASLYDQSLQQTQELLNAYNATLEGWALALELRDKETQGHSKRIAEQTIRLARRMGYDESQMENLRQGALLHDIGKMGIPDTVLLKPGTLTEAEWAIMRKHPVYARDMLSQIPFFKGSIDIPYCHHEWWDGTGYPQGLEGKQIPLAARIFAIVDAWDALISNRPYRKAWDKKEALKHIVNQAGTHFDPEVVDAFVKMLQEEGE